MQINIILSIYMFSLGKQTLTKRSRPNLVSLRSLLIVIRPTLNYNVTAWSRPDARPAVTFC